jgi:ArsR family metal-binding transcriptional regulator
MLIDQFDLEVFTPPCEPGAETFSAVARFADDITEVLPLLNAILDKAIFYPQANALTWKTGRHHVAFHPREIALSNVEDRQAAIEELEGIIATVNRTWSRRKEIVPDYESRRRPKPIEIYDLLPRTNCKECGELTCYNFALKLVMGQRELSTCRALLEPHYSGQLSLLRALLRDVAGQGA